MTFALRTSILERMCGELCDAMLGTMNDERGTMKGLAHAAPDPSFIIHRSSLILDELERANLFLVPLDDERHWWRYHHLFASLLRARLANEQPGRVPGLHRAAAAWHQEHGSADEAVGHALAAGDADWAARLVERHVDG